MSFSLVTCIIETLIKVRTHKVQSPQRVHLVCTVQTELAVPYQTDPIISMQSLVHVESSLTNTHQPLSFAPRIHIPLKVTN